MRADRERLQDVLEAIDAICRHTQDGREAFDQDELIRVWCLHHIEIIGEAISGVSATTREMAPHVPWRQIVGMRNAIIHGYFSINWSRVWAVIQSDIEPLRSAVISLIDHLSQDAGP